MNKPTLSVVLAFAAGCILTSVIFSGCSEPADRTLTIHQLQSAKTYEGKFLVDVSELPASAIESMSDEQTSHKPGKPSTQIHLNPNYEIEVVLKLVGNNGSRQDTNTLGNTRSSQTSKSQTEQTNAPQSRRTD